MSEGRILAHELEERLERVLRAKTYGELDAVLSDLPGEVTPRRGSGARKLARKHPVMAGTLVVAAALAVALVVVVLAVVLLWAVMAWGFWLVCAFFLIRGRHYARSGQRNQINGAWGPRRYGPPRHRYIGPRG